MAYVRLIALTAAALVMWLIVSSTSTRARASVETVSLASGSVISLATPEFVQVGKRYAFTWSSGGPAQTYTVKSIRRDGWILVEVADENTNPAYFVPGDMPTRWLNVGMAISIQEMRAFY